MQYKNQLLKSHTFALRVSQKASTNYVHMFTK